LSKCPGRNIDKARENPVDHEKIRERERGKKDLVERDKPERQ
jgi:hypothetical protein